MSLSQLVARPDLGFDAVTAKAYRQRLEVLAEEDAAQRTANVVQSRQALANGKRQRRQETRGISAQSLVIFAESDVGDMKVGGFSQSETYENVTDYSGETPDVVTVGRALHDLPDGGDTAFSLEKFFERPFSIYDDTWTLNSDTAINLPIWDLWSKKPAVRAKLSNYAYFKGNLHVKIAVSSTPYHYGRLMASYQPYPAFNDTLVMYDKMLTSVQPAPADVMPLYKSYLSQAPGCRVMDIKENKPLIIDIPFISYKQKFRLFNSSTNVITNATSFYDFKEAGELRLITLTPFLAANDDYGSSVSVNVMIWATDVQLGTITGTNIDITAESKVIYAEGRQPRTSKSSARNTAKEIENKAEELEDELEDESWGQRFSREQGERRTNWNKSMENKPMYSGSGSIGSRFMDSIEKGTAKGHDEYTDPGPVATVATAVTKAGEALSDIPVIGGFAKATSTIARGIGRVASIFGWSKPAILDKPSFVKNMPFTNGANLAGHETALRITCDPKQELSVDPSIGGMSIDELSILNIASRESYIGSFYWDNNDVAMTDVLWKSAVTPFLGQRLTTGITTGSMNAVLSQDSSLAFAVRPFKFWRGTIKYRFEIVCSKFHRGKLLFRYEPNFHQYTTIASAPAQLNQQNTVILDIQDGQTITFACDWAQTRAWAQTQFGAQHPVGTPGDVYGNDTPLTNTPYAFTPFGSGGFHYGNEFNGYIECRVLNELVQPTSTSKVTINVYAWCDDLQVAMPTHVNLPLTRMIDAQSSIVADEETTELVKTNASLENLYLEHFGEKVVSFRSLLKRYQTAEGQQLVITNQSGPGYFRYTQLNYPYGVRPRVATAPVSDDHPAVPQNLFSYLRHGFMGMRGSMKHRISIVGKLNVGVASYIKVSTSVALSEFAFQNGITYVSGTTLPVSQDNGFLSVLEGTVDFHTGTNGGIEFEVPFYSPNLFQFSFHQLGGALVGSDNDFGYDNYYPQRWFLNYGVQSVASGETVNMLDNIAIGEDFQFFRYMGAPPHGDILIDGL